MCRGCVVEVVPGIVIGVDGGGGVVSDDELTGGRTAASGAVVAVGGTIAGVLLDSTFAGFPCRRAGLTGLRADNFVAGLETFFDAVLEALFGDGFAGLAFK